jgi:hypothetical protein
LGSAKDIFPGGEAFFGAAGLQPSRSGALTLAFDASTGGARVPAPKRGGDALENSGFDRSPRARGENL